MKKKRRGPPIKDITKEKVISFRAELEVVDLYDEISDLEGVKRGSFIRTAIDFYINTHYNT